MPKKEFIKRMNKRTRDMLSDTFNDPNDMRSQIVDMLTNLRHLCDADGFDFHEACTSSYNHYLAEKNGED